jgi:acyl carrier protein
VIVFERVRAWLSEEFGIPEEAIIPGARLRDLLSGRPREVAAEDRDLAERSFVSDLSRASLDMVELVLAVEEELDIALPDHVGDAILRLLLDESATVQALVDLLEGYRGQ